MQKGTWDSNIADEVAFWKRWAETKGEMWPEDYAFRLNPYNELQEKYKPYIKKDSLILDCGSGMYTCLGRNLNRVRLYITCCDPLAKEFSDIKQQYNLPVLNNIVAMPAEELSFGELQEVYDFVHAQNCLDHSYDPALCFKNMYDICKPGGHVYTYHETNEGKNEHYHGLHQWNFFERNANFIISDKNGNETNVSEMFPDANQQILIEGGWILYIIQKPE